MNLLTLTCVLVYICFIAVMNANSPIRISVHKNVWLCLENRSRMMFVLKVVCVFLVVPTAWIQADAKQPTSDRGLYPALTSDLFTRPLLVSVDSQVK